MRGFKGFCAVLCLVFMLVNASSAFAQDTSLTTRVLTLADTRPFVQGAVLLLGGVALYAGGLFLLALRQRHPVAWRASVKMAGWLVPLLTALVTGIMILNRDKVQLGPMVTMSVLQLVLPLGAAIHTALIFAPEDEPLEMLFALPRPLTWLVFERLLILVLIYAGIGLMAMGLLAAQNRLGDVAGRVVAWLPSMLFLMSFTLYLTTRVRTMTMGLVGALAVWFITLLFGPFLMPAVPGVGPQPPFPMNYVQPFLWTLNMFAQPLSFPAWEYYTLNRLILLGLSTFWLWRTAVMLHDTETMLLAVQDRQMRRKAPVIVTPARKRTERFHAAPVSLSVLRQIAAMWFYEWKLHWRRRPLKVILLTLLLTTGVVLLISYDSLVKVMLPGLNLSDLAQDQQSLMKGIAFMKMSMTVLMVVQMLILPVILSDTVPLDQQDHMDEMLHSLPLPGWAYLAGKIGGLWWASMSAIALAFVILSGLWLLIVGVYDPRPMIDAWLLLSAPMILFNGGFALLIGATQPTRRRAVLAVIIVFFVSVYLGGPAFNGLFDSLHLNPFNASLLLNIFAQNTALPFTFESVFTLPSTAEFMVGRGLIFLITALLVGIWWTLRWSGVSRRPKPSSETPPTAIPASQKN